MKSKKTLITVIILVALFLVASIAITPLVGISNALASGTYGNATAADILSGKTVTTDAGQITGTMLNQGSPTFTPNHRDSQAITPGYYAGGSVASGYAINSVIYSSNLSLLNQLIWSKSIAASKGLSTDSSGNIFAGGSVIQKFTSGGSLVWNKSDVLNVQDVAVDSSGNVYMAYNNASGTKNIRKLDNNGNEIWSLTDVGYANGIAVDSLGNVYVAYNNASGTKNVRKLDSNGNEIWSLNDVGHARDIDVDLSGNVYVAYNNAIGSKAVRKFNSSGVEVWSSTQPGNAIGINVDNSGNICVIYNIYNLTSCLANVVKFNPTGSQVWSKYDIGTPFSLSVDKSTGEAYVGYTSGKLRKISSSGKELWNISTGTYGISSTFYDNITETVIVGCQGVYMKKYYPDNSPYQIVH